MAPSHSTARSRSSRPVRNNRTKVQTYHEETTSDDDLKDSDNGMRRRASVNLRPRSAAGTHRSYREESTDAESLPGIESESEVTPSADATSSTQPPLDQVPPATAPTHARPRRAAAAPRQQAKRPRRQAARKSGQRSQKKKKTVHTEEIPIDPGAIPPWQTLPYQVLFDIFLRASHPLIDPVKLTRNPSVKWLVDVAVLCRAFQEPALAALYHCPPLLPAHKSHELLDLLAKPQDSLLMNYVAKVKELHVEVERLMLYKSGPLGYFDLTKLVSNTPRVQALRLYHRDDFTVGIPPWNIVESKWGYPDSLFSALNEHGVYLRSWDWNARFLNTADLIPLMLEKHGSPSFQGLKELRLLHIGDPDRDDTSTKETALATAIQALPEIERLELLESTLVSSTFLPQLPATLRCIRLCNCDRVFSEHLKFFLKSHGQNLRELALENNRHLNMSFITDLAQFCPNLVKFKMDIQIHDTSSYRDTEPHFSEILSESEIPTWPETLQEVDLIQLRRWTASTAEMFFRSLIDAAPRLRHLRRLNISAILSNSGWRDRATLRERWINQLEKVFLRHSPQPDPNMRSLRKRPLQPGLSAIQGPADDLGRPSTAGSDPSTSSKRHSERLATRKVSEAQESTEPTAPGSSAEVDGRNVQGMCDVVMVRIDNLRPSDTQFQEADFLDEEASGDDDWNGDDYGHGW